MNPNVGLGQRSELPSCFVCRYSPCIYTSQMYEIQLQSVDSNISSFADTLVLSLLSSPGLHHFLRYPTEDEIMRVVPTPCRVLIRCRSRKENN